MKEAMKAKDQAALRGIRAIKSAILLFKTDGSNKELDSESEIKLLQKLVKQRQDSADIYIKQNREDLAKVELEEIEVISKFLPAQLSDDELENAIQDIVTDLGANSVKEMGRVIGVANKLLAGKADGKRIADAVKNLLK